MRSTQLCRARMFGGAALLALASAIAPTAASAQAAQPQDQAVALQEIVVTAQRRAENLQEVPIAVTAVTAESLADVGIEATNALPQIVPSVQMTRSGPSGLFFVRGVGTTNAAAGEEGANAIYVDNVYLGDLSQTINNFNNISRIEVLKGPQGTLFGRNATGGLIHIITEDPGQEFVLRGQVGYGNYDTLSSKLYIAGPLSDMVSADLALTSTDQKDGWGRNLTRNEEIHIQEFWGARSKVVVRPSDRVKLTLAGDYFKNDDNLAIAWRLEDGVVGAGGTRGPGGYDTTSNMPAMTRQKIWGLSFTAEADLDFATLTSITAMRRTRNHSDFDVDGAQLNLVNIDYVSKARTYQQEFRLASNSTDPLSWQAGLFYLRSEAENQQQQRGLAFAPAGLQGFNIAAELITDSYAAFGEATYAITPTTRLTAGLRYTTDRRKFDGAQTPVTLAGVVGRPGVNLASLKYDEFTYRVALRQDITDDINVYASVNRGFKAGSFSLQAPLNAPVDPQFIMAYEVGLKSEFFDRRLRLNLAAYHYDIDDYQIRSAAVAAPASSVLLNAATVKVDGFDLEFEGAITRDWRVFGGFTILDSRFDEFGGPGAPVQAPIAYPNPATCPAALVGSADPGVLGAGPRTGGFTTCLGDASGNRMPMAPEFTASLGTTYTISLGERGDVRLSALYSYNDGYVFEPDNVMNQGAFSLLNASIEYRPKEHLAIELWGNNLTDEHYAVQKITTGTGVTTALGAPRTYGVNVKFDF